jgi:hypothetical protein
MAQAKTSPATTHITINSKCDVVPAHPTLHARDQLEFHCGARNDFYLLLPGGVFEGHDDLFLLHVDSSTFVPNPPLVVRSGLSTHIVNYVYDNSGHNCRPGATLVDPPDMIIQS